MTRRDFPHFHIQNVITCAPLIAAGISSVQLTITTPNTSQQLCFPAMQCIPRASKQFNLPLRSLAGSTRSYAVQAPGAPSFNVFDRQVKYLQRERAASDVELSRTVDTLRDEIASRLCERLLVGNMRTIFLCLLLTSLYYRISIASFLESSTSEPTRAMLHAYSLDRILILIPPYLHP